MGGGLLQLWDQAGETETGEQTFYDCDGMQAGLNPVLRGVAA